MKLPPGIEPSRWIINRANSAYEPHVARPTPNKPPQQATPVCDAIRDRKLPLVLIGQGDTARLPDPQAIWNLWMVVLVGLGAIGAVVLAGVVMYR